MGNYVAVSVGFDDTVSVGVVDDTVSDGAGAGAGAGDGVFMGAFRLNTQ